MRHRPALLHILMKVIAMATNLLCDDEEPQRRLNWGVVGVTPGTLAGRE